MRDYASDYSDYDSYSYDRSSSWSGVQTVALIGALALIATPIIRTMMRRYRSDHPVARTEPSIDKQLKDTFPASDPPSSRYFDIPENRL